MSEFAWLGIIASAAVSTLALASFFVMAVPYFDDAPYLTQLRERSGISLLVGLVVFAILFVVFYLGAVFLDEKTSGPLLLFALFIMGLPIGLLLGSETWDWRNPKGMNSVPGLQAVIIATGIGLAELISVSLIFMMLVRLA